MVLVVGCGRGCGRRWRWRSWSLVPGVDKFMSVNSLYSWSISPTPSGGQKRLSILRMLIQREKYAGNLGTEQLELPFTSWARRLESYAVNMLMTISNSVCGSINVVIWPVTTALLTTTPLFLVSEMLSPFIHFGNNLIRFFKSHYEWAERPPPEEEVEAVRS